MEDGRSVVVGDLARDHRSTWFEYRSEYLKYGDSLSPFAIKFAPRPQAATSDLPSRKDPLHGVFLDALPDGWGLALMDRAFRRHGIEPYDVAAMDRLAFIGARGGGALYFEPATDYVEQSESEDICIESLALNAARVFDGDLASARNALERSGGSGGARPKAYLWSSSGSHFSTEETHNTSARLVKFTAQSLPLKHDEGRCEFIWLAMARLAGIDVQEGQLIEVPGSPHAWLSLERFDCTSRGGRRHLHSASGLLGADHRLPSLDYMDLVRLSEQLTRSPASAQEVFRRSIFNLFSANQDDHSKNWAWLLGDDSEWRLSPAFDLTFSPSPSNEHMTSFCGYGRQPPVSAVKKLAELASLLPADVRQIVASVIEALSHWPALAGEQGVSAAHVTSIAKRLERTRKENLSLLTL